MNPSATRQSMRTSLSQTIQYLYKHDKHWIQFNLPIRKRPNLQGRKPYNNYASIDNQLSQKLESHMLQILSASSKPFWITRTYCAKFLKLQTSYRSKSIFPMVWSLIDKSAESYDAFLIRRIAWGLTEAFKEGWELSFNKLRLKCAIRRFQLKRHAKFIVNEANRLSLPIHERAVFD